MVFIIKLLKLKTQNTKLLIKPKQQEKTKQQILYNNNFMIIFTLLF